MTNYEKMLAANQVVIRGKIEKAKKEINFMLDNDMEVCVCDLVKRTGLSRGFFYQNEEVKKALEHARKLQEGKEFHKPQDITLNKATERRIIALQKQIEKLKAENARLFAENQKLQKALNRKELAFLKSL